MLTWENAGHLVQLYGELSGEYSPLFYSFEDLWAVRLGQHGMGDREHVASGQAHGTIVESTYLKRPATPNPPERSRHSTIP